jgi:hypothetical protein
MNHAIPIRKFFWRFVTFVSMWRFVRPWLPIAIAAVAFGCSAVAGASAMPDTKTWHVVALGDSGASGKGDPTRLAWPGRYGTLLRQKLKLKVKVDNLAEEGLSASALLARLRSDATTRTLVRRADIILFGSTAGANLNAADANLDAGKCKGEDCYRTALKAWGRDFEGIVKASIALRRGKKTVLRGVGEPNVVPGAQDVIPPFATVDLGLYQAKLMQQTICASMARHHGRCVDVLHAFNGPNGRGDAYKAGLMNKVDCCYASGKGHQLIAQLLLKTGLAPLR